MNILERLEQLDKSATPGPWIPREIAGDFECQQFNYCLECKKGGHMVWQRLNTEGMP